MDMCGSLKAIPFTNRGKTTEVFAAHEIVHTIACARTHLRTHMNVEINQNVWNKRKTKQ